MLYRILIASTIDIPDESLPRRLPSMFGDGTKVGFSFQTPLGPTSKVIGPSLRLLVEPGGVGLDLPNQINASLATVGQILENLSWSHLSADINRIARIAFPENPSDLSQWWGGVWLGSDIDSAGGDLRLYVNLRHGGPAQRWQRVADILSPYATKTMESAFLALVDQVACCSGLPVGLALVLKQGGLRGIRLYVGIDRPTPATVCHAMPPGFDGAEHLRDRLESLVRTFGPFEYNAVTVAYDLALHAGLLLPGYARFKADVGCTDYRESFPAPLDVWIEQDLGVEAHGRFLAFTRRLQRAFGGAHLDYLSFGFRKGGPMERTYYFKPLGLAPHLP